MSHKLAGDEHTDETSIADSMEHMAHRAHHAHHTDYGQLWMRLNEQTPHAGPVSAQRHWYRLGWLRKARRASDTSSTTTSSIGDPTAAHISSFAH